MEPIYKGFKDIEELIYNYIKNEASSETNDTLFRSHDHVCWLNPTGTLFSRETRKKCKKFCKTHNVPKESGDPKFYDCDHCPNLITYYKAGSDILFAVGNSWLYKKEGKIE